MNSIIPIYYEVVHSKNPMKTIDSYIQYLLAFRTFTEPVIILDEYEKNALKEMMK